MVACIAALARCLSKRIVKLNVKRVKQFGIPATFRQAIERGFQALNVGSGGALGSKSGCIGLDDLPQLVDFEMLQLHRAGSSTENAD